jgi:hypothetical protein
MSNLPLDTKTLNEHLSLISSHSNSQEKYIKALIEILKHAVSETSDDTDEVYWIEEAQKTISNYTKRIIDQENERFNLENEFKRKGKTVSSIDKFTPAGESYGIPSVSLSGPLDLSDEGALNKAEANFGPPLSEEELAAHFNEVLPNKSKKKAPNFNKMSLEEIEAWEKEQDNSNDLFKVKGRIKNHATIGGASILPAGEGMINSFAHVCKALYDFAETLQNKEEKIKLYELIRKQEIVPSQIISAFTPGKYK